MKNLNSKDKKILIVDDHPENLGIATAFLKKAGYDVAVASSGPIALKRIERIEPLVILLDIKMPDMDGFEVCQKLKENSKTSDIPVIFMTVIDDIKSITKGFKVGGVDYIIKPVKKGELLARVLTQMENYINKHKLLLQKEKIETSLIEKELLLGEIHHRVRNNLQIVISLLKMQAERTNNKKIINILEGSQNRIKSMALVHEKLYQNENYADINISEYLKTLTNRLILTYVTKPDKISLELEISDISCTIDTAIPCGLIINELVSNSLKYAFPQEKDGQIKIAVHSINENLFGLEVSDNGIGIPKDIDFRNAKTMGLYLVKMLTEYQLDGEIELNRTNGTKFQIRFKKQNYKQRRMEL